MTNTHLSGRRADVWTRLDDAVLAGSGDVVCWLSGSEEVSRSSGRLVVAAPQLLVAVESCLVALGLTAEYIPEGSEAEAAASRAVGAAYVALRDAGSAFFESEGEELCAGD